MGGLPVVGVCFGDLCHLPSERLFFRKGHLLIGSLGIPLLSCLKAPVCGVAHFYWRISKLLQTVAGKLLIKSSFFAMLPIFDGAHPSTGEEPPDLCW